MPPAQECECGFRIRTQSDVSKPGEMSAMRDLVEAHKEMALHPVNPSQAHTPVITYHKRTPEDFDNAFIVDESGVVGFK